MARILTGIQSTGTPHLGNLTELLFPIELSKQQENENCFLYFDLHSFTTVRDPDILNQNTYAFHGLCFWALIPIITYFIDNLM